MIFNNIIALLIRELKNYLILVDIKGLVTDVMATRMLHGFNLTMTKPLQHATYRADSIKMLGL